MRKHENAGASLLPRFFSFQRFFHQRPQDLTSLPLRFRFLLLHVAAAAVKLSPRLAQKVDDDLTGLFRALQLRQRRYGPGAHAVLKSMVILPGHMVQAFLIETHFFTSSNNLYFTLSYAPVIHQKYTLDFYMRIFCVILLRYCGYIIRIGVRR